MEFLMSGGSNNARDHTGGDEGLDSISAMIPPVRQGACGEQVLGELHGAHERERTPGAQQLLEREGARDDGVVEHGTGEGARQLHATVVAIGYRNQKVACSMLETKPTFGLVVRSLVQVMVSVPFGASRALWHGP